jgi:hypothetical protein
MEWTYESEQWEDLPIPYLALCLEQAEKAMADMSRRSDNATDRAYRWLSILVPVLCAELAYIALNFKWELLTFAALISASMLFAPCFYYYNVVHSYKQAGLGYAPSQFMNKNILENTDFSQNAKMICLYLSLLHSLEIQSLEAVKKVEERVADCDYALYWVMLHPFSLIVSVLLFSILPLIYSFS